MAGVILNPANKYYFFPYIYNGRKTCRATRDIEKDVRVTRKDMDRVTKRRRRTGGRGCRNTVGSDEDSGEITRQEYHVKYNRTS